MKTLFDKLETDDAKVKYEKDHPWIWREFEAIALGFIKRGITHYGAKAIFEIMRFHKFQATGEVPKLNNNMTKFYAQKFHRQHPMYDGFFEIRGEG